VFGVAVYFARQQVQTLRRLSRPGNAPDDDRRYFRNQAWRRLVGCALLVAIGALITYSYVGGLQDRADEIGERRAAQPKGQEQPLDPDETWFGKFYIYYWGTILLLLMLLMFVAAWDVWAIRRYGARHYRRIQDDRRAMIERQLVELRRERRHRRNGPSNN